MSMVARADVDCGVLPELPPRIRMTVLQDEDGSCKVIEHDLRDEQHRPAAKFPRDQRRILVEGEEAVMDVAQIRAILFAQTWEKLVNEQRVILP